MAEGPPEAQPYVVDASVASKLYLKDEALVAKADALRDAFDAGRIVIAAPNQFRYSDVSVFTSPSQRLYSRLYTLTQQHLWATPQSGDDFLASPYPHSCYRTMSDLSRCWERIPRISS